MILITRPKAQSKNLHLKLKLNNYATIQESFYSFKYYRRKVSCHANEYYIFPSINSVESLKKSRQIFKFRKANILAIGSQVKKLLIKSGCKNLIVTTSDSKSMLKIINSSKLKNKSFTYLSSNVVNEDFFIEAHKKKLKIKKKIIYKTISIRTFSNKLIEYFKLNKVKGVVFYSQLPARIFIHLINKYRILSNAEQLHIFCISERVARLLKEHKFNRVYVAKQPNELSIVSLIKKSDISKV